MVETYEKIGFKQKLSFISNWSESWTIHISALVLENTKQYTKVCSNCGDFSKDIAHIMYPKKKKKIKWIVTLTVMANN